MHVFLPNISFNNNRDIKLIVVSESINAKETIKSNQNWDNH
jgi:hypothetical protein